MTKLRIAIITNVIPSYRKDFYRRLIDDDALETEVFCQSKIPGMNLNLVHDELGDAVTVVPRARQTVLVEAVQEYICLQRLRSVIPKEAWVWIAEYRRYEQWIESRRD